MPKIMDSVTRARIEDQLNNTRWLTDEIANYLQCPIEWVNEVVGERWDAMMIKVKGQKND